MSALANQQAEYHLAETALGIRMKLQKPHPHRIRPYGTDHGGLNISEAAQN